MQYLSNLEYISASHGDCIFSGFGSLYSENITIEEKEGGSISLNDCFNNCSLLKEVTVQAAGVAESFKGCNILEKADICLGNHSSSDVSYQSDGIFSKGNTSNETGNFRDSNCLKVLSLSMPLCKKFSNKFTVYDGPYSHHYESQNLKSLCWGLPETTTLLLNFEFPISGPIENRKIARAPERWSECTNFEFNYRSGEFNYILNHDTQEAILQNHFVYRMVENLEVPANIDVNGKGYKVVAINDFALNKCTAENIKLSDNLENIGNGTFSGCIADNIILPEKSGMSSGYDVFANCANLSSIRIPYGAVALYASSLYGCSRLSYLKLPSSLSKFEIPTGDYSFTDWREEVSDPLILDVAGTDNLMVIADSGIFELSDGIILYNNDEPCSELEIPEGVTDIQENSFKNIVNISTLILPASLKGIGDNAFLGCLALSTVISKSVEAPAMSENTFSSSTYDNALLRIPKEADDNYDVPGASYYWYLFKKCVREDVVGGVEKVLEDMDSEVEFFDLQGHKVSNPSAGIFIMRKGSQTKKIAIK